MRDLSTLSKPPKIKQTMPKKPAQQDPDAKLRERLNKLKETDEPASPVSQAGIESKFRSLTGRDASSSGDPTTNAINKPQPKLTETEQVNQLLDETNQVVDIDNKYDAFLEENRDTNAAKVKDMERRLMILKGMDPDAVQEPPPGSEGYRNYDVSSEDEEEAVERIMQRYAFVPTHEPSVNPQSSTLTPLPRKREEEEPQELPWCCICNDDATLRCHGCDGDLFCSRCFRECHDDSDTRGHATSPYKAKSKK